MVIRLWCVCGGVKERGAKGNTGKSHVGQPMRGKFEWIEGLSWWREQCVQDTIQQDRLQ